MELVIVMAIIALGAVLMVPNIGAWLPNYRLRSAARDVVSAMRVAQMKAVTSNIQYQVAFKADGTYVIRRTSGGVEEGGTQSLPSGISIDRNTFGGGIVVFNPNSTASAGNMVLKNTKGTQKTISVLSTTGRVRISD
jgi:type IV fimbrial biogenesis protein FimT